ncbi:hypothetical protein [Candidatus Sororendozoicomonas aggregata]|uniref:hypothetical protein n=1 Tax=Candidatus Sororendozoicomonas aggregata TaxID=3073239 RepID=UPI002ECFCE4F
MFDQSIQFPSVAVLSFVFSCMVHSTLADAKVYSVAPHSDAKAVSEVKMEKWGTESVDLVSKLKITVPKYDKSNYVDVKGDVYYKLKHGDLIAAHNTKGWFNFSITNLEHGGLFHKEKYTIRVWCKDKGSDGYIIRKDSQDKPKYRYIIGSISCEKG